MDRDQPAPRTLLEKVWSAHVVAERGENSSLIYIDRHLLNEVTSPQAFEGLRMNGRAVRQPLATVAVADHNVPTSDRSGGTDAIVEPESRTQVAALELNVVEFDVPYIPLRSRSQGIVHVVGPELGLTLPGTTIVCGDSHTSTHGAFGALAFGIGTSEVEHVLSTQTLVQQRPKSMLVRVTGQLRPELTAKDLILHIIRRLGSGGATGYVIEYAGDAVTALDMAGRMTLCNMSIEAGARAGMVAPDDKVFDWLRDACFAPKGLNWELALADWRALRSDPEADFDKVIPIDAEEIGSMVTWGTNPEAVFTIDDLIPHPDDIDDEDDRARLRGILDYMGLEGRRPIKGTPVDVVFIGSCTNGRIEDLRAAAQIAVGRSVAPEVRAMVVPGSGLVKALAEQEGLDRIFRKAGFEWREPGCSMCLGMNPDQLEPGQRCASTSNRNFQGRQGPGGRTHLMSPRMAAAAAIAGCITDPRELKN